MNNTNAKRALILTQGYLDTFEAKTAHGLIRGTDRFEIAGIIDGPETAGKDAGELLDGKHRNIPVFRNLAEALAEVSDAGHLIIGIATVGGVLPETMEQVLVQAIKAGLNIVNGLHDFLSDRPELVALAAQNQVTLTDIRKPKKREQLHFWTGEIFNIPVPIIAVIGMDCAMGKRTTARMICQESAAHQLKATMIYTGQTGWMQGGQYGFIFDSTLNDFVSGELEHAIVTAYNETRPNFIVLEGQSSLRNPSGPCGLELLISGNAKHVVLLFSPKRKYFDHLEAWGAIPSVESEVELIEKIGSKVIALAMHTEGCTETEIRELQSHYREKLNIPVLLPLQEGLGELMPVLQNLGTNQTTTS
jgi:uncharacterized NAD-dependent epimerase/dehydratase family protein